MSRQGFFFLPLRNILVELYFKTEKVKKAGGKVVEKRVFLTLKVK
jgi:hypothetical protein